MYIIPFFLNPFLRIPRIIFQFTHADDSRESVVLEYMDQCHMLQCHDG